jgi:hypothetical protein
MDSPVQAEIIQWCGANALSIRNGLIQNTNAISLNSARKKNVKLVLRWRNRLCEVCSQEFDIMERGLFYNCKRC